jgi:hypothetical protein
VTQRAECPQWLGGADSRIANVRFGCVAVSERSNAYGCFRPIRASLSCPRGWGRKRYFESRNCFNIRQMEEKKALCRGSGLVPDVRFSVFQVAELLVRRPKHYCRWAHTSLAWGSVRQAATW